MKAILWIRRANAAIRALAADSISEQAEFFRADAITVARATSFQIEAHEELRKIEQEWQKQRGVM